MFPSRSLNNIKHLTASDIRTAVDRLVLVHQFNLRHNLYPKHALLHVSAKDNITLWCRASAAHLRRYHQFDWSSMKCTIDAMMSPLRTPDEILHCYVLMYEVCTLGAHCYTGVPLSPLSPSSSSSSLPSSLIVSKNLKKRKRSSSAVAAVAPKSKKKGRLHLASIFSARLELEATIRASDATLKVEVQQWALGQISQMLYAATPITTATTTKLSVRFTYRPHWNSSSNSVFMHTLNQHDFTLVLLNLVVHHLWIIYGNSSMDNTSVTTTTHENSRVLLWRVSRIRRHHHYQPQPLLLPLERTITTTTTATTRTLVSTLSPRIIVEWPYGSPPYMLTATDAIESGLLMHLCRFVTHPNSQMDMIIRTLTTHYSLHHIKPFRLHETLQSYYFDKTYVRS